MPCAKWHSSAFHFQYPNTLSSQISQNKGNINEMCRYPDSFCFQNTGTLPEETQATDNKNITESRHASSGHCNLISHQLNNLLAVSNMQFLLCLLDSKTSFEIHCNVQNYKSNYNKPPLEWSFVISKLLWDWFLF